jgi:hypothetical protein
MVDLNRYQLNDMDIEFKKSYIKSYNEESNTQSYLEYGLIPNTNNIFLPTETNRKDSVTYIKLKDKDLWLHMDDNNKFFFDIIRKQDFYYRQPLAIWLKYNKGNEMLMFKYFGKGLNRVNDIINEGISNIMYINYKQKDGKIYMEWTYDINKATKIIGNKIDRSEYVWKTKVIIDKHKNSLM